MRPILVGILLCLGLSGNAAAALSCDTFYFVDPSGNDRGTIYLRADGSFGRAGYIPAGTLITSPGEADAINVPPESIRDKPEPWVPFTSEFGQAGLIRLQDIASGALSDVVGATVRGDGEVAPLACDDIDRLVAPDTTKGPIRILNTPSEAATLAEEPTAANMATVLVLKSDYTERLDHAGQLRKRFLRVYFRVGSRGAFNPGWIDRWEQTDTTQPGTYRLTAPLSEMADLRGFTSKPDCGEDCYTSILADFFGGVSNAVDVARSLLSDMCGPPEQPFEIEFSASAGLPLLARWFGIDASASASRKLIYKLGDDEQMSAARWFHGQDLAFAVQRKHGCVDSDPGFVKSIGVRFRAPNLAVNLAASDLKAACFSVPETHLRTKYKDRMYVLARRDRAVFEKYIRARHLIQNLFEDDFGEGALTDAQLLELDRVTWSVIEQVIGHQDTRTFGLAAGC